MSLDARLEHPALAWLVGALVAALYLPALAYGFVNWDDGIFVYENPLVTQAASQPLAARLATAEVGYPIPATIFVYGALWRLGGGAAAPFHGLNIALHGLNVALFVTLLRRRGTRAPMAALAGLAFGLHPVVVEPVVWVTGLKDLLCTAMILGAVAATTGTSRPAGDRAPAPSASPRPLPGRAGPLLGVLAGLLAMAAKPVGIVSGPALAIFAAEGEARRPDARRDALVAAAIATVLGVAWALWTAAQETPQLRTRAEVPWSASRPTAALGLAFHHLCVPVNLSPIYRIDDASALHLLLAVLALAALAALAWRQPTARPWLGLALLGWLPVSNLVPLERFTADSYLYLPWLGLVGALATSLDRATPRTRRWAQRVGLLLVASWALLGSVQRGIWRDERRLWSAALEARPEDPVLVHRLGDALGRAGELDAEIMLYLAHLDALRDAPQIPVALPAYFEHSGAPELAAQWYARALSRPNAQAEGLYAQYEAFARRHPELAATYAAGPPSRGLKVPRTIRGGKRAAEE